MSAPNADGERQAGERNEPEVTGSSLDWARRAGIARNVMQGLDRRVREKRRARARRRMKAGALFIAVLACVGVWRHASRPQEIHAGAQANIRVSVPEHSELPDGSIVEWNDGAQLKVEYQESLRTVRLLRGEAHFQVVPEPSRPFVVVARGVEVRAVGTSFAVNLAHTSIEVLVTEGRVAVEKGSQSSSIVPEADSAIKPRILDLDAGRRVVIETGSAGAVVPRPIAVVQASELKDRLAWRVPRLEFSGTPLNEALATFNRYSPVRLTLVDPGLGSLKVSGIVRADNLEALLQLLELEFKLVGEREDEGEVRLKRRVPTRER